MATSLLEDRGCTPHELALPLTKGYIWWDILST